MARKSVRADKIRLDRRGKIKRVTKPEQIKNIQDLKRLNESLDLVCSNLTGGEQKYYYNKQRYNRALNDINDEFKKLDAKSNKAFSQIVLNKDEINEIYELHDNINRYDANIKRDIKKIGKVQDRLKEMIAENTIDSEGVSAIMNDINKLENKIAKTKTSRNKKEHRLFEIYGLEATSKVERKEFIDLYCKKQKYEIANVKNEKTKFRRTFFSSLVRGVAFISGGWVLVLANKAIVKPTKKIFHKASTRIKKGVGKYSGFTFLKGKLVKQKNKVKSKFTAKTVDKMRKIGFSAQQKAKQMEANAGGMGGNLIAGIAKMMAKLLMNIINILVALFWIIVILIVTILPILIIGIIMNIPNGSAINEGGNYKVVLTDVRDDFQNYANTHYSDMNIVWKLEDMMSVSFTYKDDILKASDKEKEILFKKFIGKKHEDKEYKYREYTEWKEFDKKPSSDKYDEIVDISTTETVTSKKPNKDLCYQKDFEAPTIPTINIKDKKLNVTVSDNVKVKNVKIIYNLLGFDMPTSYKINKQTGTIKYDIPTAFYSGSFKIEIKDTNDNETYYSLKTNGYKNQNLIKKIKVDKTKTGLKDCLKNPPLGDITEEVKHEKWKAREIKEEYWSTEVKQETETLKKVNERVYIWYECKSGEEILKELYDINPYQKEKDKTLTDEEKDIVTHIFKEWKNKKKIGKAEYKIYFTNNWRILNERYKTRVNMINGLLSLGSSTGAEISLPKGKLINTPILGLGASNITSHFGWRPNLANNTNVSNHTGTDFAPAGGNTVQIVAGQSGEIIGMRDGCGITSSGDNLVECGLPSTGNSLSASGGNNVLIQHYGEREDGTMGYYYSWYAHMHKGSVKVKVGDKVKAGQHIGNMGSSGMVTGPHLHLELFVKANESIPISWSNRIIFDPALYINF